jgi:hypothetical protein
MPPEFEADRPVVAFGGAVRRTAEINGEAAAESGVTAASSPVQMLPASGHTHGGIVPEREFTRGKREGGGREVRTSRRSAERGSR